MSEILYCQKYQFRQTAMGESGNKIERKKNRRHDRRFLFK